MRLTQVLLAACLAVSGCHPDGPPPSALNHFAPKSMVPAAVSEDRWAEIYANARERWIEFLKDSQNGIPVMRWVKGENAVPGPYQAILVDYMWAVSGRWAERGEFRFVVVDHMGQPVTDATYETWEIVKLGADLEPRFRVKKFKSDGEQRIALPKNGPLELHIESDTWRPTEVYLPAHASSDPWVSAKQGHDIVQQNTLHPPLTPDGPVRIMLQPYGKWRKWFEDSLGRLSIREINSVKQIPPDVPVVVSSEEGGGYVPVPKRGVYMLLDGAGKMHGAVDMDAGELLGMCPTGPDSAVPPGWSFRFAGSGKYLPEANAPFRWVLYESPQPITKKQAKQLREDRRR